MRPLVAASLVAVLAATGGCAGEPRTVAAPGPEPEPSVHFRPDTRSPAADVPRGRHLTARVAEPTWLRTAPGGRRVERIGRRTEFGSPVHLAVRERRDGWLKVISTHLPNGRHGWIPERRTRLGATDYEIRVDRSARRAELRRDGRVLRRFAVAVGRPGNETPVGRFAVTDKLRPTDPTSPYGCCAIALSGHQTRLEPGWPGGDRLAIHGTPQPETVGRPVSLGCMRAREHDLKALLRRVPLGAPVVIRA